MTLISRVSTIVIGIVVAVGLVFGCLWVKTRYYPSKPHPQVNEEIIVAGRHLAALHEEALKRVKDRLSMEELQLKGIEGTRKHIEGLGTHLDSRTQRELLQALTFLELKWESLKSEDKLLDSQIAELQIVIKGLELGERRGRLENSLQALEQGIQLQKEQFASGDLTLSSLVSTILSAKNRFESSANDAARADLRFELEAMTMSAQAAIRYNNDQKEEVLADEVSWRALKRIVDTLPFL
jgi:hypothetical protein